MAAQVRASRYVECHDATTVDVEAETVRAFPIVRLSLRSLRRNTLRAGLTALGIVIGVAAIITMVGLGNGAKARIEETLIRMASNYVVVTAMPPFSEWSGGIRPKLDAREALTLQDYEAIQRDISYISLITPRAYVAAGHAKAGRRRTNSQITGWNASGFALHSRIILRGASFSDIDIRRASSVCLITEASERKLFPGEDSIGRSLLLNGTQFRILGIIQDDKSQRSPLKPEGDVNMFVPITSLLRRIDPKAEIDIALTARNRNQLSKLKLDLGDVMESRRGGRKVEFTMFHQMEGVAQLAEGSKTMTALLAAIAGVSLLVGGIGIMNVMLVSVTERTKEIGLRLALGAREGGVLDQFLIEAIILSVLGGLAGIGCGIATAKLLTRLNDWPTLITSGAIFGAFLCSTLVGILFGYYPARQAARMDPIQALRTE